MNRTGLTVENGEIKSSFPQQQDNSGYTYEGSYAMYTSSSSTPTTANQPLPGQPPLPPMPPPPGALPPLPHVFGPVAQQVASIQTWAHPPPPPWQWITPQGTALQTQAQRDMASSAYQRDAVARGSYTRRDRFNHNRNQVYSPRNSFHRNKNRRPQRFDQQVQGQFDTAAYFSQTLAGGMGLDWQRNNIAAAQNEALINHMAASIPGHEISAVSPRVSAARTDEESGDQGVKIISEVSLKKSKQRKPMSQNYPSRPWNREDAERALQIENEYNKTVRAQSLIIKFPDPDLNKDIVRDFHPGIQNIHFQSPSGPRYCFIQMAENVNIDKAIRELEKIQFGVGNLKVERKSLRDEDNPMPEEIDPYTLYVGNLPESVNVNEVKSKFPTAARVDVGYAQKMRNTRYAFIRYTNVGESIAAYKKAHDLMWDTRSIIVRFRRQRGNTCLPGEPKNTAKKVKEELSSERMKTANCANNPEKIGQPSSRATSSSENNAISEERTEVSNPQPTPAPASPITKGEISQPQMKLNWRSQLPQIPSEAESAALISEKEPETESVMITAIKEEPEDYDDMDFMVAREDDDDDDDDDDDEDVDDDEDDMVREEDIDDIENDNIEEDDDEEEDMMNESSIARRSEKGLKDTEAPDALDQMFGELENMITCDIKL